MTISEEILASINQSHSAYADRLGSIGQAHPVFVSRDLIDKSGGIVLEKGARLDKSNLQKVSKAHLLNPLENQIVFDECLNKSDLHDDVFRILSRYSDLQTLVSDNEIYRHLASISDEVKVSDSVMQNLTLLKLSMPDLYEKSLFSAVLATLLGKTMSADPFQTARHFFAGLLHDIGMVKITPELLSQSSQLKGDQWALIQSHVFLGEQMLVNMGADAEIARAVKEHHERQDGTGYPMHYLGDSLSTMGQVIAICDELQAIRINKLEAKGLNLANALTAWQLNSSVHLSKAATALREIFSNSSLQPIVPERPANEQELASLVIKKTIKLRMILEPVRRLRDRVRLIDDKSVRLVSVERVANRLIATVEQSHMFEPASISQAYDVQSERLEDENVTRFLCDVELMLNETSWHLENMRKDISEYLVLDAKVEDGLSEHLLKTLSSINICLDNLKAK